MKKVVDYFYYFISFAFIGYLWETIYTLVDDKIIVNSGVLTGPWLPIYGVGGIMIYFLSLKIKSKIMLFLSAFTLSAVVEYFTSYFLEKLYSKSWWNYTNEALNLNGRIYLFGLLAFAVMGMIGIYILIPFLNKIKNKFNPKVFKIIIYVVMGIFCLDLVCSLLISPNISDAKIIEASRIVLDFIKL